jgi:hypothetical protein
LSKVSKGSFGRRIGDRREVAENLIHIENSPQARGAGLAADPPQRLVQKQGHKEHALGIVQMGDGKNGDAGFARGAVEHTPDIQRLPFHPGG